MKTGYKTLTNIWMISFICIFSFNAHADRPSYSFISFEYVNRNIDAVIVSPYTNGNNEEDVSFDGVALAGSIEINDKWFAELSY